MESKVGKLLVYQRNGQENLQLNFQTRQEQNFHQESSVFVLCPFRLQIEEETLDTPTGYEITEKHYIFS